MSTAADNLMALHGIKADLFAATREKGLDTTGRTLENLHELWGGISGGGALQAKTAVPSNVDVEVTPDDGYAALSAVTIAEALNLKPWNIRKGKTLFGVTGTADIAVTTEVPSDIPVNKDDADTAYEEAVGSAPKDEDGNDLDMMTLADDNGNITYGYFLQGAANGSANGTCLYNGVELPDINTVWTDKETYPYAVIVKRLIARMYYLYFSQNAPTVTNSVISITGDSLYYHTYISGGTEWAGGSSVSDVSWELGTAMNDSQVKWSNHDILNTDGTVYLAASDPIPLDYNTIIRWDGNTEGLVSVANVLYKVSNLTPPIEQLIGAVYVTSIIGETEAATVMSGDIQPAYSDNVAVDDVMVINNVGMIAYSNNITFNGITVPEAGIYFLAYTASQVHINLLAYNPASPSGFTITSYDPITTNFAAVGWRRLSYHTTGELAGQWTYDDFSTTASSGGNFLKNIIQCSREKLYYNGAEVWPNPDQSAITAEEVTT